MRPLAAGRSTFACLFFGLIQAATIVTYGAARLQTDIDVRATFEAMQFRKAEQIRLAKPSQVFYGFQFSNQVERSQITFHPGIVDDCTRFQKATIYDHGTGLAAADVDGDGRTDLFFVNQIGGCELWRNVGGGRFENITAAAGVGLKDKICVAASFADVDNDGDPDLFVTTVRTGNVLFENLGGGKFRDVSKEAGLDFFGHSSAAVFFDFDNDGLLDLFVSNVGIYTTDQKGRGGYYAAVPKIAMGWGSPERSGRSLLFKNLGGLKFKEVGKEMGVEDFEWSPDATFCDLNGDGFPDLYVLNMNGPNNFFENQGGKKFVDRTKAYFVRTVHGSMGVKFLDFNQDGKLDLFVTDMHSDMSPLQIKLSARNFRLDFEKAKSEDWCGVDWTAEDRRNATNQLIYGNALYARKDDGAFAEISDKANAETFWPWGPSVGDLNADGFEDAFITAGMGFPLRYAINSVLLNDGGKRFVDAEFLLGVEPRSEIEQEYFTLDCSGEDKTNKFCYHKTGKLNVRGVASSRSAVVADFDGDGDLDIVTSEFNDAPQVLMSNLSDKRQIHFVQIKLAGTTSNRDGLGAVVRVKAGGKTLTQQNDGKSGYLSQSSLPLYFGLGDATNIDAVEVTWPSGTKQTATSGIGMNRQITLTEPRK
jgi:hypothetical protein